MRALLITVPLLLLSLDACSGTSQPTAVAPTSAATAAATSGAAQAAGPATTAGASAQAPVSTEKNPPGDIPDSIAFVPYRNAAGHYSFTHPEGWAQTGQGPDVLFTDKLNGVQVHPGPATSAPTVAQARTTEVPALQRSQPAFELRSVRAADVPAGRGVLVVYRRNSAADPVTGRQYRDEVERYELVQSGREVVMELYGPVGADNVDAYRTMVQSLAQR